MLAMLSAFNHMSSLQLLDEGWGQLRLKRSELCTEAHLLVVAGGQDLVVLLGGVLRLL